MKIALLGASGSGKTVYLSALYYRFRNVVTLPTLTAKKAAQYAESKVNTQVGFRFNPQDSKMERILADNAAKLSSRPIRWPEPTSFWNKFTLSVTYDFVPIPGTDAAKQGSNRSYSRTIEIYDPSGEVFHGRGQDPEKVLKELRTCDVAIVFLPADVLIDAYLMNDDSDEDNAANRANANMSLGIIESVVDQIGKRLEKTDIFPVCFAISKSDKFYDIDIPQAKLVKFIDEQIYHRILIPLSKRPDNHNLIVCGCSVSVVNPATDTFNGVNLEWPFLFACFGTILRNSQFLRADAAEAGSMATAALRQADALRASGWWNRFTRWVSEGETVGKHRSVATTYQTNAGRLVSQSSDDRALAKDIWASLAIEGREVHGMRVYRQGRPIDDPHMEF
jgi:hypothetical protein